MKLAGWVLIALGLACILQYAIVEAVRVPPLPERLALALSLMSIVLILGGLGLMSVKRLKQRLEAAPLTPAELARKLWRLSLFLAALGSLETALAVLGHGAERRHRSVVALLDFGLALLVTLQARWRARRAGTAVERSREGA